MEAKIALLNNKEQRAKLGRAAKTIGAVWASRTAFMKDHRRFTLRAKTAISIGHHVVMGNTPIPSLSMPISGRERICRCDHGFGGGNGINGFRRRSPLPQMQHLLIPTPIPINRNPHASALVSGKVGLVNILNRCR